MTNAAPSVRDSEISELIDSIHVRADSAHLASTTDAPRAAATAAPVVVESWPPHKPITGELYVRVLSVELPAPKEFFSTARTPLFNVSFEGETYTSTAGTWEAPSPASEVGLAHFVDEEYIFNIEHYFGGAVLSLSFYERGLFSRTKLGKVSSTTILLVC